MIVFLDLLVLGRYPTELHLLQDCALKGNYQNFDFYVLGARPRELQRRRRRWRPAALLHPAAVAVALPAEVAVAAAGRPAEELPGAAAVAETAADRQVVSAFWERKDVDDHSMDPSRIGLSRQSS